MLKILLEKLIIPERYLHQHNIHLGDIIFSGVCLCVTLSSFSFIWRVFLSVSYNINQQVANRNLCATVLLLNLLGLVDDEYFI